jgi:pimeloyl-ACP methyl ester carboxylesterase
MTALAHTRTGAGEPLVLLHGIGSSRRAWDPVIPALAERFDVVAVDLPGFGDSEPLPPEVEPRPGSLAAAVAGLLDDLGITAPHVAGNSLGGWVALELAGLHPVASLTLLRDHLLVRRSRQLGELPPSTRRAALPHCGHVPMADDPPAVAALITASAARARPAEQAAR